MIIVRFLNRRIVMLLLACIVCLSTSCATVRELGSSVNKAFKGQTLSQAFDQDRLQLAVNEDRKTINTSFKQLRRKFQETVSELSKNIQKRWGKNDVDIASPTQYVKYTDQYQSRAIVNFDHGHITVETLNDKDASIRLQRAVVMTLLTSSDPQTVDLFSDQTVTLKPNTTPYLYELVLDHTDNPIRTPEKAEQFAEHLLKNKARIRTISSSQGSQDVRFVRINMVKDFEQKKEKPYRPLVRKSSKKYDISPSLIYAIIKTESNFNPYAVSSAPAYGLMQLVPTSGGREAYRQAKGEDKVPSPNFLFQPDNNIELGTAYLHVLTYREMKQIQDAVARDYCVIAAYNTGPGNVFKTFAQDRKTAVEKINRLSPSALYRSLRTSLPYKETRNYLKKVVTSRKDYTASVKASL